MSSYPQENPVSRHRAVAGGSLARAVPEVRYNPGPGGTRLYHTDAIALLDEKGGLVRMIFGASRLSAATLAEELKHLVNLP